MRGGATEYAVSIITTIPFARSDGLHRTTTYVEPPSHELITLSTYQELLLARKRLVFTETQAYFQCYEIHRFETLRKLVPRIIDKQTTVLVRSNWKPVLPEEGMGKFKDS